MSLQQYVRQVRPRTESYIPPVDKVQNLFERVDTTLNASVTELFPCLAFNKKFRPSSIEDFKKFLYTLNLSSVKGSFHSKDADSAKLVIEKLPTMEDKFLKDKMANAIGITNYLYRLHATKPIKNVVWGYRAKPAGIPNNHAGDIFVFFKDGSKIGVSLKAGTKKSKEPLKNTYVGTQYKALGVATTKLEGALWDRVYSKIPGITDSGPLGQGSSINKSNFIKNKEVTQLYVDHYVENETHANELYKEMLVVCREHFCAELNKMKIKDFITWVQETFNLQRKGGDVPLIMVKAVGNTAEEKGDDIVDMIPMATNFHAYLNKSSVQEYLIDIHSPNDKKTLKMAIRSDSGVRPEKGTSGQGRLGQYLLLKMLYNGVQ